MCCISVYITAVALFGLLCTIATIAGLLYTYNLHSSSSSLPLRNIFGDIKKMLITDTYNMTRWKLTEQNK